MRRDLNAPDDGAAPAPSAASLGMSLPELVLALAIVSIVTGLAIPATAAAIDAGRAWQAASFAASRFRLSRQQAALRTTSVGIVFDAIDGHWVMRVCTDGNRNGLRRSEVQDGTDRCPDGPHDLETLFPGVRVAVDEALAGPDGEPGSADAVRFGQSDIASFSPAGSGTAGSLFLRSVRGVQYAVRIAGVTGRTRILRYDGGAGVWREV
jgi:prepilin-type N-terminal cleavage/methylation domain-containing protein